MQLFAIGMAWKISINNRRLCSTHKSSSNYQKSRNQWAIDQGVWTLKNKFTITLLFPLENPIIVAIFP